MQALPTVGVIRVGATLERGTTSRFWELVDAAAGAEAVEFDLSATRFVDSAGMRALVDAARRLRRRGGRVTARVSPGALLARLREGQLDRLVPVVLQESAPPVLRAPGPSRRVLSVGHRPGGTRRVGRFEPWGPRPIGV